MSDAVRTPPEPPLAVEAVSVPTVNAAAPPLGVPSPAATVTAAATPVTFASPLKNVATVATFETEALIVPENVAVPPEATACQALQCPRLLLISDSGVHVPTPVGVIVVVVVPVITPPKKISAFRATVAVVPEENVAAVDSPVLG